MRFVLAALLIPVFALAVDVQVASVHLGQRPFYLIDEMESSDLKTQLGTY